MTRIPAVAACLVVAAVAAVELSAIIGRAPVDRVPDLQIYLGSVRQWQFGQSLYDYAAASGAPFTYPPFAGLLFSPLMFLPFWAVAGLWSVATIAVVITLAVFSVRHSWWRNVSLPLDVPPAAIVALALLVCGPITSNLRLGQISVFLVVLVLVDLLKLVPERFQGMAIGVASAIKLTPLIFIPHLFFTGRRRAAGTAATTFLACTGATWAVLPGESVRFWLTEMFDVTRVGDVSVTANQALNGALLRWDVPDPLRTLVVLIVGGGVVVAALVRSVRAHRNGQALAAGVIVGAAGLVVSPVSWTHHQVWLILAALLAVGAGARTSLWWASGVAALMTLPVTAVGAGLPGGAVIGNARLLLAVAIAAIVPFTAVRRPAVNGLSTPTEDVAVGAGVG